MELDSTAVSAAAPSNSDHSAVRAAHIDDEAPVKEAAGGCLPRPAETHSQAAQDGGRDPSTTLPQGSVVGRSPPAPPSPTTAHCPHTAHKQASTFTAASTAPAMDGSRSSAGEGHHSGMRLPTVRDDDDVAVFSTADPPAAAGAGPAPRQGAPRLHSSSDGEGPPTTGKPPLVKRNSSTLQSISEEEMLDMMERSDMQEIMSSLPPCQCDACLLNEGEAPSSPGLGAGPTAKPHAVLRRVTFLFFLLLSLSSLHGSYSFLPRVCYTNV